MITSLPKKVTIFAGLFYSMNDVKRRAGIMVADCWLVKRCGVLCLADQATADVHRCTVRLTVKPKLATYLMLCKIPLKM